MADLLISNRSSSCDNFWYKEYPPTKPRYIEEQPSPDYPELVHSKSDDIILQNAPSMESEIHHGVSDAAIQIQKDSCVVYENIARTRNSKLLSMYFSDSDMNTIVEKGDKEPVVELPALKVTGCFGSIEGPSRRTSRYLDSSDRVVDPEHSIKEMISKNDFYKFVLFKQHYEEYLDISQKYEETRTISYYLEEKYHEVKNQRDSLIELNKELEKKLERKDVQVQEKEEELFLQIEKVFRLEEDCEKLRQEKEKIRELKEQLERDKNELYRQLKFRADESESKRISFEKTRNDLIKQFSEIVLEKNNLEKENSELKEVVGDLGGEITAHDISNYSKGKNLQTLQQQMTDLKLKAKQSATLNSQLKKGMKHLATCRRQKCSVCAYTRATFGDYSNKRPRRGKLTAGCFPFQEHRKHQEENPFNLTLLEDSLLEESNKIAKRLSECSFLSTEQYLPSANSTVAGQPSAIPFIDECSSANGSEDENEVGKDSTTSSSLAGHGFCSDSGFSSELCDSSLPRSKSNSLRRATKWTTSFRKLIRRVSLRKQSNEGT